MDIFRNIPVFVEVARCKSFRGAAENLGLPSSTVSRRVAELEKDVGLRLFNRTTRNVELTESGQLYFDRCRRIIEEAEIAHQEMETRLTNPRGVLRLSLPIDFSIHYLTPIFQDFLIAYPEISLELNMTPEQMDLMSEDIDLAIRMGPPRDPNLIARKFLSLDIGQYASPKYLDIHGVPREPSELQDHVCLRMNEAPWVFKHAVTGRVETVAISGRIMANNVGMLRQMAINGFGIMTSAKSFFAGDVENGLLVPVLPDWKRPNTDAYVLMTSRLLPAKVRVFLDFLTQKITPG